MTHEERRAAERVRVNLNARWEGVLEQHVGTISDISTSGCFILTSGEVKSGELVRVEIQLPTEGWIYQWGEVVYHVPDIGFAVRFTGLSEKEHMMLSLLIDYVRGERADLSS